MESQIQDPQHLPTDWDEIEKRSKQHLPIADTKIHYSSLPEDGESPRFNRRAINNQQHHPHLFLPFPHTQENRQVPNIQPYMPIYTDIDMACSIRGRERKIIRIVLSSTGLGGRGSRRGVCRRLPICCIYLT